MDFQQIVQLIFSGVLAFATIGLMIFTCALWIATNKYRKATERMAEIQEKASAIQEKALKVSGASVLVQASDSLMAGNNFQADRENLSGILKEIEKDINTKVVLR